jgi:hypothetical protein
VQFWISDNLLFSPFDDIIVFITRLICHCTVTNLREKFPTEIKLKLIKNDALADLTLSMVSESIYN